MLLEGGYCVISDGVKDEFFPCLFDAQVIPVTLLLDFVLRHKLFVRGCCVAGIEGICGVCSWVGGYRVGPGGIANEEPVLAFGDCSCQMAVLLSLIVVMGLHHDEDSVKLVLEFVNGLQGEHVVEACQFIPKVDEPVIHFVQC